VFSNDLVGIAFPVPLVLSRFRPISETVSMQT
jgi:hypothetical protein